MRIHKPICILAAVALGAVAALAQSRLVGVTGDGASVSETLYWLSKTDASSTFLMSLGNGNDGETIGYNPADGLLYHASGISTGDRYWESIDVNTASIVTSGQFTGPNVTNEQLAITYNPNTGRLLVTDRTNQLFDTTTSGTATDIGDVAEDLKGLAFVGSTLYGAAAFGDILYTLDPSDGSSLGTLAITMNSAGISGMNGLATNPDDGTLWAIVRQGSSRHLATINTTTGVATSVGTLGDNFAGIAFVPVPEPATMAALSLGAAALLRRRKK